MTNFDMSPEQFREQAHRAVDWMADYLAGIREYPVLPDVSPGDLTAQLPASGPEVGESMDAILNDFAQLIVPGITHWNHPRFFAYFSNSASGPGILGEMLTAALNVNAMLWKTSPSATELEEVTLSWLRQWLALPEQFFGIIYDTASISTMHAIAAARERADPDLRRRGGTGNLTLYTSEQSHSSIEKGAITLGIGQDNVRRIPVDSKFRMIPAALHSAIEADRDAGKKPFFVTATVGTTSTSSIDPVSDIADITEAHDLWLHVDAAYGGPAAIVPEYRYVFDGVPRAHSIVLNPHKWLFTPMDVSVFYTREPEILRRAFSLSAEYLRTSEDGRATNYMDYGVQLGHRFRALKLWFVFRYFGHEGVSRILRNHLHWAQRLAELIRQDPGFEMSAPTPLSLLCFRHRGSNDLNRALLEAVNQSGRAHLSHTVLNGQYVLRLAIGNLRTTWEDLEETWLLIRELAKSLSAAA